MRIALKAFTKNKLNSVVSLVGFAMGLTAFIVIALFIEDELKYDRFHRDKDRIYRIATDMGADFNNPLTPMPLAAALQTNVPEIDKVVRFSKNRDAKALFSYGEKRFYETDYMYADSSVFDVFSFNFVSGDARTALTAPHTLVVTESTARKYFGAEDPLNKVVTIQGEDNGYKVTGVVKDLPAQSHFHFSFLLSFSSASQQHADNWLIPFMFTYITVKPGTSTERLETKITTVLTKNFAGQIEKQSGMSWAAFQKKNGHGIKAYLQPLTAIHLHSNLRVELEANGNYQYVLLFGWIGVFILLLSCVNFINLTTASASLRAKEIGLRKVVGATKKELVKQFLFECFLLCFLALTVALALTDLALPFVNQLTGKHLSMQGVLLLPLFPVLAGTLLLVAILSGMYPAFYLSRLNPVEAFKKRFNSQGNGLSVRRLLIVTQFSISLALIIGVIVVYRQFRFMTTMDPGFDKEQFLVLPIHESLSAFKKTELKKDLLTYSGIQSVTLLNYLPGKEAYENQDVFIPEGKPKDQFVPLWYMRGDWDLVKTMGFHLLKGRDFNFRMPTDSFAYLLNETAVKQLGWNLETAVGKNLSTFGNGPDGLTPGRVIGVVKDFHFEGFTQQVKPMVLGVNPRYWWNVAVRVNPNDVTATLVYLEKTWKVYQPHYPFEYYFEDQNFATLWASDKKLATILSVFTAVAIGIACIGLFGLSVFATERRTKEIGIRKVLGAPAGRIVLLLAKEYLLLVFIAFLVASPLAALYASEWLRGFAYRTELNAFIFLIAAGAALALSFLTVSIKSIESALQNPVKSLRLE